jgi:Arf-GAP/coiled-coil/ANK repeat/PH domain-containing protein
LRERCQRFYKGCRKYTEGLGEAYDGDIAFASALETFGGGHDDPISVAVGGFSFTAPSLIILHPVVAHANPWTSLLNTTCDCIGPVMTKFTIALREIGTYKEVLRSQVVTVSLLP